MYTNYPTYPRKNIMKHKRVVRQPDLYSMVVVHGRLQAGHTASPGLSLKSVLKMT